MIPPAPPLAGSPLVPASSSEASLRDTALGLEAGFLREMLSTAGLGRETQELGGGAGEGQFASLLLDEQALALARSGGVGLAESLFQALKVRDED